MCQNMSHGVLIRFWWKTVPHKGAFTIYVYNARWVGDQKFGNFVNIYCIKIVNQCRWVNNFERPLSSLFKLPFYSFRKDWILMCICFDIIAIGIPIIWTKKQLLGKRLMQFQNQTLLKHQYQGTLTILRKHRYQQFH